MHIMLDGAITTIRQHVTPLHLRPLRRMIEAVLETAVVTKDNQSYQTSYLPHLGHLIW
jgi:hypothetical protein